MSAPACPIPIARYPVVTMAHGGGGRLMQQLVDEMFVATLRNPRLEARGDAAVLEPPPGARLAMTTDSFVVSPRVFPGGDIGCLSIYGTVNDLAMAGARARWLSLGLVLEEGLSMAELWHIVQSLAAAAHRVGAEVVTGDTKVVERGKGDGLYINTTGVGPCLLDPAPAPQHVRPGDAVLVSGDLGRHGVAIMAHREGLRFETTLESDCAPVIEPVAALLEALGEAVHALRDPTRGGLAAVLHEIADQSATTVHLDQRALPVHDDVRGACELLGLDPVHLPCEGRFVAFVAADQAEAALDTLSRCGLSPARVGTVEARGPVAVRTTTAMGIDRILDRPAGEQLPRIC